MRARELLAVSSIALAVAVLWTWPLSAELSSRLPHDPRFTDPSGSDVHMYVWNLWWARTALEQGGSPFWCDRIFWPHGHGLALHTHAMSWGIASLPLQWVLGLPAALGVLLLLLFASAASACFALARELGLSLWASALAAFAWSFSPYFVQKSLEHLSYTASPWPPLFALGFLRWMDAAGPARAPDRWRAALATGLCAGLALLTDAVACLYMFSLVPLLALVAPLRGNGSRPAELGRPEPRAARGGLRQPGPWLAAGLAAALASAPYSIELARELGALLGAGLTDAAALRREQLYHPRLADFFTPSGLNPLLPGADSGAPIAGAAWTGRRPEASGLYLGFTLVGLALYGARRASSARRWLGVALVLLVFTWDPGPDPEGWFSAAYRRLPVLDILRVPARLFPVAFLPLCIAAAIGFDALRRGAAGRKAALAASLFVPLEFWTGTYPTMAFDVPEAVRAIAAEPGQGAVCVLPFAGGAHVSMSWQTVHRRPVSWSYVSRIDPALVRELERATPELYALAIGLRWPAPQALALDLERAEVEHILVRNEELTERERSAELLDSIPGWTRVPTSDDVAWWRRISPDGTGSEPRGAGGAEPDPGR